MKISIVTLSFNQAKFLPLAIESVLSQGIPDLEYIVVDPGSGDGSRQIIEGYGDRLVPILSRDDGPADGLNKGFAAASGDVFGYLNSDDLYPPGTLALVANYFLGNPDADCLFGAIRIIDEKGRVSFRRRTPDRFDLARYAEHACNVWCPSTFFRRGSFEAAGGFNKGNRTCWDGEFAADLALTGARFAYTDQNLGCFRIYPGSITNSIAGSGTQQQVYLADRSRIRTRIHASGVTAATPLAARLLRLRYKFNLVRHLSYLKR